MRASRSFSVALLMILPRLVPAFLRTSSLFPASYQNIMAGSRVFSTDDVPDINVLTASAHDLQDLLEKGAVTSQHLVRLYLAQIKKHNHFGMRLNALISVAPEDSALAWAKALDEEREVSGKRGPLHGIPIVVKDSICTPSLGLDTTCGSYALVGAKASKDATIVERLLSAGALIIGKANLSEWANAKQPLMVSGWSAVGGQTQSPYVRGGVAHDAIFLGHSTPCGSSSGSAVAVAAGFVPIAVGTESDGSLVQPATRAALYGLKATVGSIPTDGCLANTPAIATSGGLAKTVHDLAALTSTLTGVEGLSDSLSGSWEGQRVGFVNFDLWQPAAFVVEPNEGFKNQTYTEMESAITEITAKGAKVVRDVPLITLAESVEGCDWKEWDDIVRYGVPGRFAEFFAMFEGTSVKTLDDLIAFNEANAATELPPEHPSQQVLINASKSTMTKEEHEAGLNHTRTKIQDAIHKTLDDYGVDVIAGPSDGRMASVAAGAGFPIATVPVGYANMNGRAFGIHIIGRAGSEATLLNIMSAWEATFPEARKPPPLLVIWDAKINGTI